ncbi:hypothetical protein CPB83DRAFT_867610 [Crepidotus variabilis]|uniref:Bacteriophage T5 Orf172 DNA-binding domain-containing protein n=1 Tax=Crepidotus variabilis TaxID=179855 RepID=A0A9P6JSS6_9AGAR|nr:hypothetical protein CPB83DRAFT_867610 [Crepidotus variabilis]
MSMGESAGYYQQAPLPIPPQQNQAAFIGGFHPAIPSYDAPSASAPNLPPKPPSFMPAAFSESGEPQSLTMQYALQPPDTPHRPHSNPEPPTSSSHKPHKPTASAASTPGRPTGGKTKPPVTPNKASKSDSGSSSGSPSKPGQEQCGGVTKAGKRCTRMVKSRPATVSADSDDDDPTPVFCYQHSKELMGPSGYYSRKNGEWIKFEGSKTYILRKEWIPAYLQPDTQASLRVEMEKPKSGSDVPGYIYTFEIREDRQGDTIKLKVGRAVNLVKRIDEWGKQCGSKEQVLRGFYPGSVEAEEASLMKGRVVAGEKSPLCHRLERLIHLELGDLISSSVYLDPSWPNTEASSSPGPEDKSKGSSDGRKPCPDCGCRHKEIFEFTRWTRGKYKGKEWEQLVKPVVERWGKFVELYV